MHQDRRRAMILILSMIAIALVWRAFVVSVSQESADRANLYTVLRAPFSFSRLDEHMKEMDRMSENIDNFSLAEIREMIQRTTALVRYAGIELKAQQDSWAEISSIFKQDAKKFEKLKQELDTIQKLNREELVRVKEAIENAGKPSMFDRFRESLWAFLLGVASSLGATLAFHFFRSRISGG